MSTSQVLDRTFYLYRNHFTLLAGIGTLLPALLLLLQLIFLPLGFPPRTTRIVNPTDIFTPAFFGYILSVVLVSFIGQALAGAATVYAVSKTHLGQSVTIGESYRRVLGRFWTLIFVAFWIYVILFLAVMVVEIAVVAIFLIFTAIGTAFKSGAGVIGVIVAIIIGVGLGLAGLVGILSLYARFSLAVPACMLEGLGVFRALGRSSSLAKGSIFRLILIFLLMACLVLALSFLFAVPGQILALATGGRFFLLSTLLQSLGSFVAGVLAGPVSTIATALVYYDQRVRKEALDLQLMMGAIGQSAAPQPVMPPPVIG